MKLFIQIMKLNRKMVLKHFQKSSGSTVEWVEEESYFLKLSKWQDKLN